MSFFFFNDTATTEIYTTYDTLSLHDALPILRPIGCRHRRPDTLELRFGGREPGRAQRRRVQRGGRQAAEISHAAAQDALRQPLPRSLPSPRCGSERPREADSRRSVYLSRDAVGANAEQRIESAVVGWRVAELRRFEAGAVGELQPVARAPRVAQVQRLVPRRPRLVERREGSAERRRPSRR